MQYRRLVHADGTKGGWLPDEDAIDYRSYEQFHTLRVDEPLEREHDERLFRWERLSRRRVMHGDSRGSALFEMMEAFANEHGGENVRLVCWTTY